MACPLDSAAEKPCSGAHPPPLHYRNCESPPERPHRLWDVPALGDPCRNTRGQKCNPGSHRLYKLTLERSVPAVGVLLGDISGTLKEKNVSTSSQHGLPKGKSCLVNLLAFMTKKLPLCMRGEQWMLFTSA
ncbi:hypothetical protein QYF61_013961 [Mycteria americana]|uniref:Uncharacterized protein n=1 Tax=Mycteria americana TaxID=33587 RepID=A0AAN7NA36_MYCAM|nr:hypothetical protein QYF61_013961 [Mycteria americana]